MAVETFLVRPQFREANEARIKWIFCYIVCDASIISVSLFHELLEMWESLPDAFWREAQYSENRNCGVHLAFLLIDCFMRPNDIAQRTPQAVRWSGLLGLGNDKATPHELQINPSSASL